MKTKLHAAAATLAFLMIFTFFSSTILVELFGSPDAVATVKQLIVWGMVILVPAMAITGITGNILGKTRRGPVIERKKKRMPFIAINGIAILMPCAFYLNGMAADGIFDSMFYGVQVLELVAGSINLTLMSRNLIDGLRLTGKLKPARSQKTVASS
ncbi:hypothetical protein HBA55_02170 [Pseudomaricurvus alkylphenolicus]|uniref:hypothetical protein n=1 Tax=Pseudomaricurvus alkylphenolicus TaxID=1306991 RepID=UPI0014242E17|nr:hypothetical protein [Pseudomaricurvus alkylphenolicus]NIB38371.1 hypothetical protein [Pseudomaricurvus alkylphenolicus]